VQRGFFLNLIGWGSSDILVAQKHEHALSTRHGHTLTPLAQGAAKERCFEGKNR
jgi:hypothetical protein